ncbi:MAG: sigma-70 family RNA polymerase sigma factor [Clostridium sp.]|uniref:sigma-70 family RNA polymerase sigma factor n=1 Tax=Clostridium sp. TaxID=1506 RepID=UPI00257EE3A0|nr:sigma-70 family RNA polymerase sigma factor [Clostridium sp.]MBS4843204.1 sigma-70 family RNA polymerase sigma factor [Clostridium sp.]
MTTLKEIIELYKKDKSDFTDLLNHLNPTIKILLHKYSFKVLEEDIVYYLWSLIEKLNINNFNNDKALYSYIYISLNNYCKSILTPKTKFNIIYDSNITDIELEKYSSSNLDDSWIVFNNLIQDLPDNQKKIIFLRYGYCFSDKEIANYLNISRQAVYKNRSIALNKITKSLLN